MMSAAPTERTIDGLPSREFWRARRIIRVIDRTIAVVEIVFGTGTLLGLIVGAIADAPDWRPVETSLGIPVMALTTGAGILLWRGKRAGLAISLGLQLFQILPVVISHTAARYVAGFQWTLRFGAPRIWKPWGFEGTFIVRHDPAFPPMMFGLNVIALMIAAYLVSRLRADHKTLQSSALYS